MTREEVKSCICTIKMLQKLAYNIHGVMNVVDADNCKKIIKALEQEPCEDAISRKEVTQSRPEWLSEDVERDTDEQTVVDRAFNRGWNSCLKEFLKNIKELPSVTPTTDCISRAEAQTEIMASNKLQSEGDEVFIKVSDAVDVLRN